MLSLPVQNSAPAAPADSFAGNSGIHCVSRRKICCVLNIFGQYTIKCNEKIGPCKNCHFVDKVGGIIAILSIFGSNVRDLFCILQKQLFSDGTGIEKGADSTTGNYAEKVKYRKERGDPVMENQKKMSMFDLVFMSIGGIIVAGIFSMVGSVIATTGRSVALALIAGMIFTMSQQIRYIFTASMFQLSGGIYSQNALVLSPSWRVSAPL